MLYFVCATWEELLHSFLWILRVPFSADSFCLWSGGQIREISSHFNQGCSGELGFGERKNLPQCQRLRWACWSGRPSLLCSGIGVCCLSQDVVTEHWLVLGSRDGVEPGAGLLAASSPCLLGIILRVECCNLGSGLGCAKGRSKLFHWVLLPAGHCWGNEPSHCSAAAGLCPASPPPPRSCSGCISCPCDTAALWALMGGVAAVPVSAPSLSTPEVMHWSSLCCTSGDLQVTDVTLWHCWFKICTQLSLPHCHLSHPFQPVEVMSQFPAVKRGQILAFIRD